MTEFVVDEHLQGKTLREYFAMAGFSTTQVKRFKFEGKICVNGNVVPVGYVLRLGDLVQLETNPTLKTPTFAQKAANVLWQDDYLFVAEKPSGMAIHPDRAHKTDTLGNGLATFFGDGFELRIVTRLDKTTSGLVLGALDSVTAQKLNQMQQLHQIEKTYIAQVEGVVTHGGKIDLPLLRIDSANKTVPSADGKEALTFFEVQRVEGNISTLVVRPQTGRTHQIRAHLAAIGHPIVGDVLYGATPAERIMLHCAELKFVHPITGEIVDVKLDANF